MFKLCIAALALCAPAYSQQSLTSATLSGRVEDPGGLPVPAVVVRLTETATAAKRHTVTDPQGRFRFDSVAAGTYELRVEAPRFAVAMQSVTISLGQALDVPVRLALSGSAETVEVTAAAPAIEAARTQNAETISPREIDDLPLNGRNYLDLAFLVPGVSRTNTGSTQSFAETSAVPGTGISVGGQRNLNNSFLLDGLSANDDAAGLAGSFFSQEVIREFQVVTSGGIAEFGRASAGVVNVITQSGTNHWHGSLYGFARNQRFDARNPLAGHKDPLTQTQYGASVGGPLRRDRLFLFSNFEQLRQNAETPVTIAPADAAALHVATGGIPTALRTTNYFARVDAQLTNANLLSARYSLYDESATNARNAGGLNSLSRATALTDRDQSVAVTDQATLSPRTVGEARGLFTRSRLGAPVNDPFGPAVNISGVASYGTSVSSPTARDLDIYQGAASLSWVHGYHSIKAGAEFLDDRTTITFPGATQGVYTFSSLANFRTGQYSTFQQAFGPAAQFVANASAGGFVQDEWRPAPSFTVNAGLRYDYSALPAPIIPERRDIAPRLGLAFSPGKHRWVIRAGAGMYYGRIPLRAVSNALQRDGSRFKTAILAFGQAGAPVFPSVLPAFPSGALVSVTTIDPHIRNDASFQTNIQVEREIGRGSVFSAGVQRLRGMHIIVSRNLNVPTDSKAFNLGRPNPNFANISQYGGQGDSYYTGMNLAFMQRASRWLTVRVSYTLSNAIDDTGNNFFSSPQNNFDLRDDRGPSDNDQRHRVTASGAATWRGFRLSTILSHASALPVNVQTGNDRNGDTNVNDRPAGIGRNTARAFDSVSLDTRLARRFALREHASLEALVEAFNTLNHANLEFPVNVIGPAFGRPTAAMNARQLQLALRLSF